MKITCAQVQLANTFSAKRNQSINIELPFTTTHGNLQSNNISWVIN